MRTSPTKSRTMAMALLPNFMVGGRKLTFERDHVQEQGEARQREEEHDVLRIDDALGERIEMGDEAEVRDDVGDSDRQAQRTSQHAREHARAEERDEEAGKDAQHETDDLVLRER